MPPSPSAPASTVDIAPKASKGKAVKAVDSDAEAEKIDLVEMRKKHVIFAMTLDKSTLIERYMCMWGRKMRAHPASRVLPASVKGGPDKFPFVAAYFYCGLCPPFSDFFIDIMYTYGFHLLDFTPNAMTSFCPSL